MSDKLLNIKNLSIQYATEDGVVKAVNGINLDLKEGETLGLVGETGAGKTTTALGMMRLIPNPPGKITGGTIEFEGRDILALSEEDMRGIRGNKISMIFQDPMTSLNPVLSVGEQISEVILIHQDINIETAIDKAKEMLELVGISGQDIMIIPINFLVE